VLTPWCKGLRVRPLLSHTCCLHCFNFLIVSPSVYSIFCLSVFPLQCLETVFPLPASVFLLSFPTAHSFLPSFLSFFFPSFSALSLDFLFSLPSSLSSTRTSPSATRGTCSARGRERRTCRVQRSLRHTHPSCLGTSCSSCISCCFQSTDTSRVGCQMGMGTRKGSWETAERGPKAGNLGLCVGKCPLKPKRKSL